MYHFEKLDAWRKSFEFADKVYSLTQKFPSEERYGLTSQLRRAVLSIPTNIAEGASRRYKREFVRFLDIALGSFYETTNLLLFAKRRNYVNEEVFTETLKDAEIVGKLIVGLRNSLAKRGVEVTVND